MSTTLEIVGILRGLSPARALAVGAVLHRCGFRSFEVPLNSPDPFTTIKLLSDAHGVDCLVGAGTVLSCEDVDRVVGAGGRLIVSPNTNASVIKHALACGVRMLPGIATATEAFAAVAAGASELKLFPAVTYGAKHLKALKSVLPAHVKIFPVGGIGAGDIAVWRAAGADGFGFGGELFTPAYSLDEIAQRARALLEAARY